MENVQTMSDFMAQIQHRIDELKAEAKAQQSLLAQELNERLTQSEAMQTQLQQSQQQLSAQLEYGTAVLVELEQGLQLDLSAELAEFEQACQAENADKEALSQQLEQSVQEKIAFYLNELKAKSGVALQELELVTQHIQQLFGVENAAKAKKFAKWKVRFAKHLATAKECLAKQLELGATKLRA